MSLDSLSKPTYSELLNAPLWKEKRQKILTRDNQQCQSCNNTKLFLDTTSTYYVTYPQCYVFPLEEKGLFSLKIPETLLDYFQKNSSIYLKLRKNQPYNKIVAMKAFNFLYDKSLDVKDYINLYNKKIQESFVWDFVSDLQVHHNYYQEGKLPWEYPDEALISLCHICHENFHINNQVPKRNHNGKEIGKVTKCTKCSGLGFLPEFKRIENGICFLCRGKKYIELI